MTHSQTHRGRSAPSADPYDGWIDHFTRNRETHAPLEARAEWTGSTGLSESERRALVASLQRFELGEAGDGAHLLGKATRVAGPAQLEALRLLIREEQAHSALFGRGLAYLGASSLTAHWSDAVFTRLRRALGLRTELLLFLIAESVAMPYFVALSRFDRDDVIRTIGLRVALDEEHHLAFQVDQLRDGFANLPGGLQVAVLAASWVVAIGAATVVSIDHGAALRVVGLPTRRYGGAALRSFRTVITAVLWPGV